MLNSKPILTLIGAGPGDPELITVKGLKALAASEVVLYDSLVNHEIFVIARSIATKQSIKGSPRRSAARDDGPELIFVGKRRGKASLKQNEINELILKYLASGKNVTRLKGGDPFIFARGVEEVEFVNQHGYEARIIPGLSSGLALPALAGVALTLRNSSDAVTLTTGHDINPEKLVRWVQLLETGSTLVIYMGLFHVVDICEALSTKLGQDFPALAISNGSLENEKIICSDLANLAQEIINAEIASPAILVLGKHIKRNLQLSRNSFVIASEVKQLT